jgi:hypothetical protein
MKGKPIEVLAISSDRNKQDWLNALKKYHNPGWNVWDEQNIMQYYYSIWGYPTYILINPEGTEIYRGSLFEVYDCIKKLNL